jgi:hypothetical protein
MKNISLFLFSLIIIAALMAGCNPEKSADNPISAQSNDIGKLNKQPSMPGLPQQLVTGLQGTLGSTIGPGGDLFVPEGAVGMISRINPRTGEKTTFASGLPPLIPAVGIGGVTDVAFIGGTAYALVTLVDDPNLFPTGQINGIYRIDGPNNYTVIADIGAYNIAHPPTGFDFFIETGVLYTIQTYRGGFLVTDGHLNRVLRVTLNGNITEFKTFNDVVPTGLAVHGNTVYMAEAGPVPHLPENGRVVSFSPSSLSITSVASGARLLVDVEFGRGQTLFALSQGFWEGNVPEDAGTPAQPNTGSLVRVNADGTFTEITDGLDRPTSLEFIGNTAYIITLTGEIWTIGNAASPPFGFSH